MSACFAIHVWCSDCVSFQIEKGLNVTPPPRVYWSTDMSTDIWTILDRYIDQHIGRHPLQDTRSGLFTILVDSSSLQSAWQGSQWRVRTAPYFSHKREIIGKTNVLQIVLGTDKHWETKSMHVMIKAVTAFDNFINKKAFLWASCLFKSTFLTKNRRVIILPPGPFNISTSSKIT